MTTVLVYCGLGVLALVACLLLREMHRPIVPLLSAFFVLLCALRSVASIQKTVDVLRAVSEQAGVESVFGLILRAIGMGLLGTLTADLCRNAGETGLAGGVELCTRVEILVLGLPLITEILTAAEALAELSNLPEAEIKSVAEAYCALYDENDTKDEWFAKVKEFALSNGYAKNAKEISKNPDVKYKGTVSDVASCPFSVTWIIWLSTSAWVGT